jgi:hypothetical protein
MEARTRLLSIGLRPAKVEKNTISGGRKKLPVKYTVFSNLQFSPRSATAIKKSSPKEALFIGGANQTRTGVQGFANLCVASPPSRRTYINLKSIYNRKSFIQYFLFFFKFFFLN